MIKKNPKPQVTFISQSEPIDEYGRALYAVARSIVRAFLDSLSNEDLRDLNTPLADVTFRQLSKVIRIDLDKGMKGDGFEWAVHEAIVGKEISVLNPVHHALTKASNFVGDYAPTSLLYGYERAKYLGFLDAVVDNAGADAYLLPEGSGRPYRFGPWVSIAAKGALSEEQLRPRIKKIWKTDIFLSTEGDQKYFAATVKSNFEQLEGGRGLRVGIVPESTNPRNRSGVRYDEAKKLWIVTLADPNGFMLLYNDAYSAVGRAVCKIGKQPAPPYYVKPSAKAQKLQEQLDKYGDVKVIEIEGALNEAAQQNLVKQTHQLVGVNAPGWLHIKEMAPKIIAPKPRFTKLD